MMKLLELEKIIAIDAQNSLNERFLSSEAMYVRFLKKLLSDENFAALKTAAAAGDEKGVELYAHTLKGVCSNLGLTDLTAVFTNIVKYARDNSGAKDEQVLKDYMLRAENLMRETLAAIAKLD